MSYCNEDHVVISSSWDKSLRIYDENLSESVGLLRKVENAHQMDIGAIAHSHKLSLIATGDDSGLIRLWDFQFLTLEGEICLGQGILHLEFLDTYPILISIDRSGIVKFWVVRPFASTQEIQRNSCIAQFDLFVSGEERVASYWSDCWNDAHIFHLPTFGNTWPLLPYYLLHNGYYRTSWSQTIGRAAVYFLMRNAEGHQRVD